MTPTAPLLPQAFQVVPYEDATPLLGDPEALRARADRDGYVYLPGLVPDQVVAPLRQALRAQLVACGWAAPGVDDPAGDDDPAAEDHATVVAAPDAVVEGQGWNDPRFVALQRWLLAEPTFLAVVRSPGILGALDALMGDRPVLATANFVRLTLPGVPVQTTRPHQDAWYLPTAPHMWTCWVPVVRTPLDVGPLAVAPGSHRGPLLHQENRLTGIAMPPDTVWASQPVEPGDVVLFGARAVHCAWSNVSERHVRLSLDVRYEPAGAVEGSPLVV